ncbi:hypothetical protein [Microbacterium suaedae]|uniref:hypothetical protein n=1 Tax=Microbacterium suaedae TaxID=2067813 RepID=UPI000DA21DD7|nr:hypothetical protein [Microbacterium suaedae]
MVRALVREPQSLARTVVDPLADERGEHRRHHAKRGAHAEACQERGLVPAEERGGGESEQDDTDEEHHDPADAGDEAAAAGDAAHARDLVIEFAFQHVQSIALADLRGSRQHEAPPRRCALEDAPAEGGVVAAAGVGRRRRDAQAPNLVVRGRAGFGCELVGCDRGPIVSGGAHAGRQVRRCSDGAESRSATIRK